MYGLNDFFVKFMAVASRCLQGHLTSEASDCCFPAVSYFYDRAEINLHNNFLSTAMACGLWDENTWMSRGCHVHLPSRLAH